MKLVISAIISFILFIAMSGCANSHDDEAKMAIGEVKATTLLQAYPSFEHSYQAFNLSEKDKSSIALWPDDLRIEVFFGSWCHDSQREVPRFLKILEQKALSIRLIGLNYQKVDPAGLATAAQIKFTPTFVVYRNNQEIGRVIERPKVSLVADINNML